MNVLFFTVLLSLVLLGIFIIGFLYERRSQQFRGSEQDALMPLREDIKKVESLKRDSNKS